MDRYGRITGDDWMGVARLAGTLREQGNKAEVNRSYEMLLKDPNAHKPEEVSGTNWDAAHGMWVNKQKRDEESKRIQRDNAILDAENRFSKQLSENGYTFDNLKTTNRAEFMAMSNLVGTFRESEAGKELVRNNRRARAAQAFTDFRAQRSLVNSLVGKGDKKGAAAGITQMSKNIPSPYTLEDYDPVSDSFSVKYRESWQGPVEVRRMGFQDAMATMNQTSDEHFFAQIASHMAGIQKTNDEYRNDPSKHGRAILRDGRSAYVIPQKRDGKNGELETFYFVQPEGGARFEVPSLEEFIASGAKIENLDRDKKIQDVRGAEIDNRIKREQLKSLSASADVKAKNDVADFIKQIYIKESGNDLGTTPEKIKSNAQAAGQWYAGVKGYDVDGLGLMLGGEGSGNSLSGDQLRIVATIKEMKRAGFSDDEIRKKIGAGNSQPVPEAVPLPAQPVALPARGMNLNPVPPQPQPKGFSRGMGLDISPEYIAPKRPARDAPREEWKAYWEAVLSYEAQQRALRKNAAVAAGKSQQEALVKARGLLGVDPQGKLRPLF